MYPGSTAASSGWRPRLAILSDIVREVVETFAAAARHAGAPIEIDAPEDFLAPGIGWPWSRSSITCISNAIKYGAQRPVRFVLRIMAKTLHSRSRSWSRYFGGDRARIFERFERAVGSDERRSGFGVGLWVVGQIVKAMGGTIRVDDAQGGGAVFTVTLPRHAERTLMSEAHGTELERVPSGIPALISS